LNKTIGQRRKHKPSDFFWGSVHWEGLSLSRRVSALNSTEPLILFPNINKLTKKTYPAKIKVNIKGGFINV